MSAPLDRDRQIELMANAKERIESRVNGWVKNPQIRASLKRDAAGHDRYNLSTKATTKVRRCG